MTFSQDGWQLLGAAALVAAILALLSIVRNNVIRRRLRFTLWTTLLYVAVHLAGRFLPGISTFDHQQETLERLLLILAMISGAVSLLNPWFRQGVPDRLPSILQDTIVLGIFLGIAVGWFHEQLAMTSAVGAAVIGFAAQDTLGNAFAGLAIQVDRPFRVGHWITVGSFEGLVTEITWRATKLRTKSGNLIVVPNNVVSKEAINNYSEPEAPTRVSVEVGASYDSAPNDTKAAILAAVRQAKGVLASPEPDVLLTDFGASALTFRVRFWVRDFSEDDRVRDQVRTFIYYEFRRRQIEIPFPIQVEYARQDPSVDTDARRDVVARLVAAVPVFAVLGDEAYRALAVGARSLTYAAGEAIVRESDRATSLFVVEHGRVEITIGAGQRVAVTEAGGYFGEMSLLTGAPRTATVTALTECHVVEISADAFRHYILNHPEALADVAAVAAARQVELDVARLALPTDLTEARASLLTKMREFFGL